MEPTRDATLAERLSRFLRWFFTCSPEAAADLPPLTRQLPVKARRQDGPQLRSHAQQAGRIGIGDRK